MNVFAPGSRHQPWLWQVTGLCFVLGWLIAGSLQTVNNLRKTGGPTRIGGYDYAPVTTPLSNTMRKQEREIADLREQNTQFEETLAKGTGTARALNRELQKTKVLAGLVPVSGPGITLVLQDSRIGAPANKPFDAPNYIIHDYTIQQVINELNASGAEAISINGQRIISRTPIRCVGPTAQINGVPTASPFEIRAIGNSATLAGGLNIPGGVLDGIKSWDPQMARLEQKPRLVIPAYDGSTEFRYARSVRPASKRGDATEAMDADKGGQ